MSVLLFDNFDHDDTAHRWTISERVTDTTPVRTGTRSYSFEAGGDLYLALDATQEDDVIYCGFSFWSEAAAGAVDPAILEFSEGHGATSHISLVRRTDVRGWEVRRGQGLVDGGAAGTGLISILPNKWFPNSWHYVELGAKIHDSTGWVELRQDGVTIARFDGDTRNGGTDGLIDQITFHQSGAATSSDFWIDDVYIINEQGAQNNSWLADERMYPSYPNGNVAAASTPLSGSDGNTTDNYLLVDEAGTPVTTDYVFSAVDGDQDVYTFQDLPVTVGTIRGIEIRMHAAKSDTGTKQIRSITRRLSTDSFGADKVLAAVPTYQTHTEIQELDPHAGPGAWTIDNFNDTEFGVEVRP